MEKNKQGNTRIGSSFDSWLMDEDIYEEVTAGAVKRRLAHQISDEMKIHEISKSEMARQMKTSRTQLDRLLDPKKTKIQLETIYKAARAVGRQVKMELV